MFAFTQSLLLVRAPHLIICRIGGLNVTMPETAPKSSAWLGADIDKKRNPNAIAARNDDILAKIIDFLSMLNASLLVNI
ncbi:hypothetical protein LN565_18490 [Xanthomonas euvesicatoria pv. euvesicatoria]|uniref:Uncharacterized protein n=1 Tax=Xanthomonas euvesicatoria pv. euvesicatoria TaxID=2753541 RepID=A0ABS8LT42_XANEU|nr:hypothetical protein [Xanthomonas euvesicatoria]MCC8504653.1 hypothetical protein [Xanthomonas euvesicatoria pv. euvesicatoria]MCC8518002.1 hypothetical protein [Xanthomonas euvesicatoria pv. euvesicatoria]MCC8543280.1 hypothetical protein [Xanthomonas euvesicatoria pv. euvesicatoria]MCC8547671.1 hypothetical protein [Xanthomonas euvesicatoria pv. euvesicatoria]MCC8572793.1 hypothetical protein [Xanthomonas euvesicatoria pv. euvesicatoria]